MTPTTRNNNYFAAAMVLLVSCITSIPFLIQSKTTTPIFTFQFNAYALLSAIGLLAAVVIVITMARRQTKTFESFWLISGGMSTIVFGIGELLQRLSVYPDAAIFWAQFSGIGLAFGAASYLLFIISYTMPEKANAIMTTSLMFGAAIIAFFQANGGMIFKTGPQDVHLYPWGYNNDIGPAFIANVLWFVGLPTIGLVLMLLYRRQVRNKILRAQSTIFIIAIAAPVIGGLIFDILLPALGSHIFPPLGMLFITVTGGMLLLGLWKYRIFELSPAILSQNILTTMKEAVIVANEHLEIEYVNGEAEKLLRSDSKSLFSRQVTDLFTNGERIGALRDKLATGAPINSIEPIEDMSIKGIDERRFLRILISPVSRGGAVEGFIFVISDVTELQKAYIELAAAKAGVERIVAERTRELRDAQAKLLETDKLKTEFIMLASHNLRTPLATIQGYLELLNMSDLDGTQRHALESLDTSSKRLSTMIDELLTISTIEASDQPMERRTIPAVSFLESLVKGAESLASTSGNKFLPAVNVNDAHILASTERLGAAVRNILDNAFKFTRNGEVRFTASESGDDLRIEISDTGIGITADELPKLFTKFHRGSATLEYNYEGKGLGLYLAKLIINEHDGTINVSSQGGKGTTVMITLPIVSNQA